MIELNKKTQQDFLNREWVQRLLDAGVDMSDAHYFIANFHKQAEPNLICTKYEKERASLYEDGDYKVLENIVPTYTVSELLYKLHEWIYPTINGEEYSGGLILTKDAPFYPAYYLLTNGKVENTISKDDYIYAEAEYPIESLAMLLIQCHKKDIGIKAKDTGDISDK